MFVRDAAALGALNEFLVDSLSADPTITDMALLAAYRSANRADLIDALPIIPSGYDRPLGGKVGPPPADGSLFSRRFEALHSVFDAAAIGQYLFGVDPRNKIAGEGGFINETCVFDPSAFRYLLLPGPDGRLRPYLQSRQEFWPFNNLHIHARRLPNLGADASSLWPWTPAPWQPPESRPLRRLKHAVRRISRRLMGEGPLPEWHGGKAEAREYSRLVAEAKQEAAAFGIADPGGNPVDVYIPTAGKDLATLPLAVHSLRRNLAHPIAAISIIGPARPRSVSFHAWYDPKYE